MEVIIDGDACPVKDIIMEETAAAKVPVIIVSSIAHYSTRELPAHVSHIYVDNGKEAADYRIMQLLQAGDLLVTQDYGLASLAMGKKCTVIHHKGFEYTALNIDQMLESRYHSALMRKSGKRTKGPKPFTRADREQFRSFFHTLLQERLV